MTTVTDIKKIVTHFSEQIKQTEHKQEVTVAGRIVSVTEYHEDYFSEDQWVAMNIDDFVGIVNLFVLKSEYDQMKNDLKIGNFVKSTGYVNQLKTPYSIESSIYAYDIQLLK